jgi:predicted enzyme related to lactoylglutathione lyase
MNRVIHFEVQADDVKRAKEFYQKTFGWKIDQMMKKEDGGMDYWGLNTGEEGTPGINGGLYERPKDEKIYHYDCTISVDDIDKAISDIKKNGGKIRTEKTGKEKNEIPGVGWFAAAIDTEGNMFGIMQPTGWQPK